MNVKGQLEVLQDVIHVYEGLVGENEIRGILSRKRLHYFQAEIVFKNGKGRWGLIEVKHQERFEPPPFEGHGLPRWQLEARMGFYKDTGVVPYLIIVEKPTGIIYSKDMITLSTLDKSKFFDTNGTKPRRIFKLSVFDVLKKGKE